MKVVIVLGALGYIGSECSAQLESAGYKVIRIDKVSSIYCLNNLIRHDLTEGGLELGKRILDIVGGDSIEAIINFAAYKSLPDSIDNPLAYYENNLKVVMESLEMAKLLHPKKYIFSSSAAVYSNIGDGPVSESDQTYPRSPYGYSKLVGERIVIDTCNRIGVIPVCLRYFNPAGRTKDTVDLSDSLFSRIGLALNKDPEKSIKVFGTEYSTRDGSCIRDFIHISDLVDAHLFVIKNEDACGILNVGTGIGTTVLEVVEAASKVASTNRLKFKYEIDSRRSGDLPIVYANTSKINKLGWSPKHTVLDIVRSLIGVLDEDLDEDQEESVDIEKECI